MRKLLGTALFAVAALAALLFGAPDVDQASNRTVDSQRAELMQPETLTSVFDSSQMNWNYDQPPEPDINQLLSDYPTAAGQIRETVRDNLAYEAAAEGDYEQAYRQMALAFKEGKGKGSYSVTW
ncbi:hypothetical protein FCL40_18265 [Ferrimonas sediminicola]|uniref:Uncharacterized protein n=1 Tax=Ferrimonas sediminicola TaxID=2569538 RepID=A0A4U1B7P9_9GAMM|nr:hypothetical protein [Ferrimonas sediminicola]TKB46000.1 hypothetical protein FCL40_18265 [Ferrimonas sediminicola]